MQLLADFREMVHEQFEYRELLYRITARDLMLRYKQTFMGFGWAIFMPLLNTAIFSVIFTRVAPLDVGLPYPLFAYCGLLAWNLSASALRFSVNSLTSNSNLVTKIYFPREIFPISAVVVSLVDTAVGSIVLGLLMIWFQTDVSWTILFLPIILFVQVLLTIAIGLLAAMGNLFYRDVKYLFEFALTLWMFATSVVYPVAAVGGTLGTVLSYNPMTPIVDAYRSVLFYGTLPSAGPFLYSAVVSIVLFAGSWLLFHRAEFKFAERI